MASRATWRPAGLGTLKTDKVVPVAGKFPCPKKITLDFAPENKNACPIFAGRLIRGVKNGPAPKWVQDRFKAVGLKSISALVDATNLITQDRGRPLHVFDADKLTGNLHARMAKDGEQVLALDDKTYTLDADTIVIADDAKRAGHRRHHGRQGIRQLRRAPSMSSSNPPFSIRRASPAPAASRPSSRTRAIASSAASIRNWCCRGWSFAPG